MTYEAMGNDRVSPPVGRSVRLSAPAAGGVGRTGRGSRCSRWRYCDSFDAKRDPGDLSRSPRNRALGVSGRRGDPHEHGQRGESSGHHRDHQKPSARSVPRGIRTRDPRPPERDHRPREPRLARVRARGRALSRRDEPTSVQVYVPTDAFRMLAEGLARVRTDARFTAVTLAGHSEGGLIALRVATQASYTDPSMPLVPGVLDAVVAGVARTTHPARPVRVRSAGNR